MSEDLKLIKKDLMLILHLNSKMNYSDQAEVQNIHNAVLQKMMFRTTLGQKFVTKLEYLMMGTNDEKCILCDQSMSGDGIICPECLEKYKPKPPAKKVEDDDEPQEMEITLGFSAEPEKADDLIPEKPDNEPPKTVKKDTKKVSKKDKSNTKNQSKFKLNPVGTLIVILPIILLAVLGIFVSLKAMCVALAIMSFALTVFFFINKSANLLKIIGFSVFVISLILSIALFILQSPKRAAVDAISYLGMTQEELYKTYDKTTFYYGYTNILTNEGNVKKGHAIINIVQGQVYFVVLDINSSSNLSIANVHIGDDKNTVVNNLSAYHATYDSDNSISGQLEIYNFTYNGRELEMIIKFVNDTVARINCGFKMEEN